MTQKATLAGRWFYKNSFAVLLAAALTAALAGCGNDSYKEDNQGELKVNSPSAFVNESADDYDDNVNGLITFNTLSKWIDDWDANKPKGVKGKLVIIQQSNGAPGAKYIKPNNENVFTYVASGANGWTEARNDGILYISTMILSGPSMDARLKRFGIDVNNDMIVCAQGTSQTNNMGRCWYSFTYWGVPQNRIALLDGNNAYWANQYTEADYSEYFSDETVDGTNPSPIIQRQISSVKDLKDDNFALFASVEDLINVLPTSDDHNTGNGAFIWDARSLTEYKGGDASPLDIRGGTRQSHPRGAIHFGHTDLFDGATGRYKSKQELQQLLNGGELDGKHFVGADYQPVGEGNAYQPGDTVYTYCETAIRAGTTATVAGVILGYPTRIYDASMKEWNTLTATKDKYGIDILPANSPWDTSVLSGNSVGLQPASDRKPRSITGWAHEINLNATNPSEEVTEEEVRNKLLGEPLILNPHAQHANKIVEEDRAYKAPATDEGNTGGGSNDSNSGGGPLVTNPCG